MEVRFLGDEDDGPTLDLDHEQFAYAGKFVTSSTGKAVAESETGTLLAAAAFSRDRTDPDVVWIRYVTTRCDRRGEGIGAALLAEIASELLEAADSVRIAVNNPFAYEAAYKAGFGYTGSRTGIAELVLERPMDTSTEAYQAGLSAFRDRESLHATERAFLEERTGTAPPERCR